MKISFNKLIIFTLAFFLVTYSVTAFAQSPSKPSLSSPKEEVRVTIDEVVKVAVTLQGDSNKKERREKLRKIIEPRFDFAEMAQRSLGAFWSEINEEQRKEFVDVFSNLLARTYLERIETVEENMVKINSEEFEDKVPPSKALVRTTVERKGDEFPINYKLSLKNNIWRVYDVIIENIGLVSNYRNEFAGIIRKEKFEGLMLKLKKKSLEG